MLGVLFIPFFLSCLFYFFLIRILLALSYIIATFMALIDWAFFIAILNFFTITHIAYIHIFFN